jgi:hypothetical protein
MSRDKSLDDAVLADDLLWGVNGQNGIAAFLGIKPRQAYHLIKSGALPVTKHGHRIITARRSELCRHFTSSQTDQSPKHDRARADT